MKTKNNVQKTIAKTFAIITSFVLISFTVNAQDFWKTILSNTGFNEIALAMVEPGNLETDYTLETSTLNAYTETENEETIELENWMTNETMFVSNYFQLETENELTLENWMTSESPFEKTNFSTSETEKAMELERWMTTSACWEK